jgi:hypothetical protein
VFFGKREIGAVPLYKKTFITGTGIHTTHRIDWNITASEDKYAIQLPQQLLFLKYSF